MDIVSCSLGCSSAGAGGSGQIACGIQDVFVNGELHITFSDPVDPSSLNAFSFQVIEALTGKSPSASRFVDPSNPHTVIYRPALTFDSTGSPVFGLTEDATYTLKLPGVVEDPGASFVRSTSGSPNQHRMLCTLQATQGVLDATPGAPTVSSFVDVVLAYDPGTGEPSEIAEDVPAPGAVDVYKLSPITLEFNDVMNPATLVNPVTGTSTTITVSIDPDGNVSDPSDQVELLGSWDIQLDLPGAHTTAVFQSELGFPSAGSDLDDPRRIVVTLGAAISDLGGNGLSNPGPIVFVPEVVLFDEVAVQESFDLGTIEDVEQTGAEWGTTVPGALVPGVGGGAGVLGPLHLDQGEVLELDTDSEDFAAVAAATLNPAEALGSTYDGTSFTLPTVTGGVFEFSSLEIDSGSVLRFTGSNPPRLIVRGEAQVRGVIDVGGEDALTQESSDFLGGEATSPGPTGGGGGAGGDLPTWVGFEGVTGTLVPDDPEILPPTTDAINGDPGIGVPDNLIAPTGTYGAGAGGVQWPNPLPDAPGDLTGLGFQIFLCEVHSKGGFGGGGAYGLDGQNATNTAIGTTSVPQPPAAPGGKAADFGLGIGSDPESPQRTLDPEEGWLHGGAGGGGAAGHILHSSTNGQLGVCVTQFGGAPASISKYMQHSSAAGGAGAGALQVHAGRSIQVFGILDVGGGNGGNNLAGTGGISQAAGGGGGAGGGLLMQSPEVVISGSPGRLDIEGGLGGSGITGSPTLPGVTTSKGGNGGAGVLRIETIETQLEVSSVANAVLPNPASLTAVGATPDDVIGIGTMVQKTSGPTALSGAQSCWIQPEGNFFLLDFLADDAELGWDMTVLVDGVGEQSFRGENDLFPDPLETVLGDELGSSPVIVRFQGARSVKEFSDPCDVTLVGETSPIAPGSLTAWVKHPSELNTFHADPALAPNMIRFQILFDASQPNADLIQAVHELVLRVQPD